MDNLIVNSPAITGVASFNNFEEIKASLEEKIKIYESMAYTADNLDAARNSLKELEADKKEVKRVQKELKAVYSSPFADVEQKLSELLEIIDRPYLPLKQFISEEEKKEKREEIMAYAQKASVTLGEHAKKVLESPAFFDDKWLNKTTTAKNYQDAITEIINQAANDINTIQMTGAEHISALMARYYENLSMDGTKEFLSTLESGALEGGLLETSSEDAVIGYKVLKIYGTSEQMANLMNQLDVMGMECDEIEDGMPKDLEELELPDFDSFVAFDIETSGTFGAANGDGPAEITEIGVVKVVDGVVVDKKDWLCNPGRKITPMVSKLTHITDEMVADQPSVSEVISEFRDYIEGFPIVGHNIKSSDLNYINKAAKRAGVILTSPFFDTYIYAKKFKESQGWDNVKLEYLSEQFGIEQNEAHRAGCDAEANVEVYFKLRELQK